MLYRQRVLETRLAIGLVVCLLSAMYSVAPTARGQATQASTTSQVGQSSYAGPYCGLYCLYVVIKLTGQNIDFVDLIRPYEFFSSRNGSTLAELEKAAKVYGIHAVPVVNLDSRALRESPYPIILHVKQAGSKEYDHYELLWGVKDGAAQLFNPPGLLQVVPFHELAQRWDGKGLVVSDRPIDIALLQGHAKRQFLLGVAVVLIFTGIGHAIRRQWAHVWIVSSVRQGIGRSVFQCIALVVVTSMASLVYHFVSDEGMLAYPQGSTSVANTYFGNIVPHVDIAEARRLLDSKRKDIVFVDARYKQDYEKGHIDGAINVSVMADDKDRKFLMGGIPGNAQVIVYCQSRGCPYANLVGAKLSADGFVNVSICKGGWLEWKHSQPKVK